MSEEKAQVLQQIDDIKSHLVDNQTFFPYNYRATYVWAMIGMLLTFLMIPLCEKSILLGAVVASGLIAFGFMTEGILTIKVNQSYDIEACTHKQQFIMKNFLLMSFFMITMSSILASYRLYIPMFLLWLFLVSMGYFAAGFVLNIRRFTQMSQFNMMASVVLLALAYTTDVIVGKESIFIVIVQMFLVFGLSIMPSMIAWQQIKEGK